jgi:adenylate cyclase
MERRLAAILAADVVGYSRLMEADEAGTLAALRERRKTILEPVVAQHHGRIVKLMGDGALVEFASAVNAVQCAIDLQKRMVEVNAGLPDDRRVTLRIGVNLGDVVVEGGDIHGDGVNVAARLEGIANPGGICISAAVREQVERLLHLAFEDMGDQALKNLARTVHVYAIVIGGQDAPPSAEPAFGPASRPSVAILPFTNMSGDPGQEYFSDGITEDIITELSRFRELFVLARNSSFQYRNKAVDVRRIGHETGAQYVVEGSVRRLGDRIRITAQLIDVTSGNHIWGDRFDRDEREIFAVQDQIVRTIAGTLVGRVEAASAARAGRKPPESLAAYECILRAQALPLGDSAADTERKRLCETAIRLDPRYGRAFAWLAHAIFLEWFRDMGDTNAALDRALVLAQKAVQLDENDTECKNMLGWVYLFRKSFDLAEQHMRRALELNPGDPEEHAWMGALCSFLGKPEEAVEWFAQAKRLDPFFEPVWYWHMLGIAHFVACRYDDAIAVLSRSATMPIWVPAYLAACHALMGRIDHAQAFAAEVVRRAPDFSLTRLAAKEPYKRPADRERLLEGMRKAGLPE